MTKKRVILIVTVIIIIGALILGFILLKGSSNKDFDYNVKITGNYSKTINFKNLKRVNIEKDEFTIKTTANKEDTREYQIMDMTDVLKAAGIKEYNKITIIAEDGFSATIEKEDIEKSYFGVRTDDSKKENGLTSIVPEKGSKFWIKNIAEIKVG